VGNPHASQFEFRTDTGPFVQMFDLRRPGDGPVWTGHYSKQGRPMLDSVPPGLKEGQDPHMVLIAEALNEAVKPLNEALRHV